jgi:glycosyltransferase involved in cell wall biosynthesis
MRIGVNLLYLIPGEVGGTETYAREMLRALAQCAPEDRRVLFCNRENRRSFGGMPGTEVVECPVTARRRAARVLFEQLRLPRRAAQAGVDVLWSPGYTAPFRAPCPQAVTIHDVQYRHHPEDFSRAELAAMRLFVWISCRRARGVITASRNSADDLARLNGVPPERIAVTPYGVSEFFTAPEAEARRRTLTAEAGVRAPFILTVANSYPHKNLAGLVAAFARIEKDSPHDLVVVGHARRGEAEVQTAMRLVADPARVRRLRGVPPELLRALYQSAELFVFPSLFEGFGLPVIEAMAAGAPVACSDIPTLREVAGDAAAFFDPRDAESTAEALRALLEDPQQRDTLAARGRERARAFTWERTARATREVFLRLAEGRAATGAAHG